eukprot:scaffold1663_cov121-Skeletonema_dohrnii-CCMP3373.AAC.1
MLHCGEAVTEDAENEKWIAQLWLRQRGYEATAPMGIVMGMCLVRLGESPYPPLRIGPTASKSLREWGGTQKRRKIKNFKLRTSGELRNCGTALINKLVFVTSVTSLLLDVTIV